MDESKKQFKLLYDLDNHTYTIWVQNDQGYWERNDSYVAEDAWKNRYGKWQMISERILWMIDFWIYMDYEFIGIEHWHKEGE